MKLVEFNASDLVEAHLYEELSQHFIMAQNGGHKICRAFLALHEADDEKAFFAWGAAN